jgi:hypothetical protein
MFLGFEVVGGQMAGFVFDHHATPRIVVMGRSCCPHVLDKFQELAVQRVLCRNLAAAAR